MSSLPVYFDYAATTPVDPRVAKALSTCLTLEGNFANPASRTHRFGWMAEEAVEAARADFAHYIGADNREIVWTSGATEANNLALKGAAFANKARGRHIVTTAIEHKAVIDTCLYLETQGFELSYVKPEPNGVVSAQAVIDAIRSDTLIVSVMHVNNETGVINPIDEIGHYCRQHGVIFHVDAAQSLARLAIDVNRMNIDLLSVSGHKIYGPKGIGALYVRRSNDVSVEAQIHGGGHERNMRSGTLPTHQIIAFAKSIECLANEREQEQARIAELSQPLLDMIEQCDGLILNGETALRVPGILNIGFEHIESDLLLTSLRELAISTGSACTSASIEPSHVLKAMRLNNTLAKRSIRLSLGRFTQAKHVEFAVSQIKKSLDSLQKRPQESHS